MNNKRQKIIYLLLLLIFPALSVLGNEPLIVQQIKTVLINEYDNYQDNTWIEKVVLKLGKNAFIDSVEYWSSHYQSIGIDNIQLHKRLQHMLEKTEKHLDQKTYDYFEHLLLELTLLGYRNLDIYLKAVNEYLAVNKLSWEDIDITLIDEAVCQIQYYEAKKELYKKEDHIKNEIKTIFNDERIKYKMAFYSFAFNFFNKIRTRIIEKDMIKMEEKIYPKESILSGFNYIGFI